MLTDEELTDIRERTMTGKFVISGRDIYNLLDEVKALKQEIAKLETELLGFRLRELGGNGATECMKQEMAAMPERRKAQQEINFKDLTGLYCKGVGGVDYGAPQGDVTSLPEGVERAFSEAAAVRRSESFLDDKTLYSCAACGRYVKRMEPRCDGCHRTLAWGRRA